MLYLFILSLALLPGATARLFTIVNACPFTIWPAMYTDPANGTGPVFPTGWESPSLTSAQFAVPDNWKSGRIWGRRACDFSTNPGSCLDGGCKGGLQCTGIGSGPVTVAEWTLQGNGNVDSYDVSLVNGFNLPMAIIPTAAGCNVASCPIDLNPQCPAQIVGPRDPTGLVVGCNSACSAGLDNAADSANCCTGTHNTQTTCPSTGVQYYNYFKGNCPNAYAFVFDGASGTALWTCNSALISDYKLTFCPPPPGYPVPAPISAVPASLIPSGTASPTAGATGSTATQPSSRTSTASTSPSASKSANGKADPRHALALVSTTAVWAFLVSGAVAGWLLVR